MEIFQHIFDTRRKLTPLFRKYGLEAQRKNGTNKDKVGKVKNKSKVSSTVVLKQLEKDRLFMSMFNEITKFEQKIYDVGVQMHKIQYESIGHSNKRK
jgi:hypothetical protein